MFCLLPPSVRGRAPTNLDPATAGAAQRRPVQFKRDDGGPAYRRQPDDVGAIVAPTEMNGPFLRAGIEQRDPFATHRICCVCLRTFIIVA